jgi:predicted chitinase
MLTASRIKLFAPLARADIVDALVDGWPSIQQAGVKTPLRLHHFMAQIATETQGLTRLEENLNYSAKRLTKVWPGRFPSIAAAEPYAYRPQALANKVYGGRFGNHRPDDGWRFRGGGLLHTTFRENYRDAGYELGPDLLRTPGPALRSALKYWTDHGCNAIADRDDLPRLRRVIQGGSGGLDDAAQWLVKAKRIFTPLPTPVAVISGGLDANRARPAGGVEDLADPGAVANVQARLRALGYYHVGADDGALGASTQGAILAFRNDNGLRLTPAIDAELLVALSKAEPKPVPPERADGKPERSRILSGSDKLITGSIASAGIGAAANADDLIAKAEMATGYFDRARGLLSPLRRVKEMIDGAISPTVLLILLAIVVGVLAWRIRAARIADYRAGKTP